jgi:Uncharacterized protein conserved in bacteria (DUF2188)
MAQMWYDIVPHNGGWAIMITSGQHHTFATKMEAYDAAVEVARKLRFSGYSVHVHVQHKSDEKPAAA